MGTVHDNAPQQPRDSVSGSDAEGDESPISSEVGVLPEVSAEWKWYELADVQ